MSHQNVFTLIKSDGCGFCKQLMANWSDIEKKLKLIDPNVLIEVITMDKSLKLDNDKYPKHLTIYAKWFPMIIAMPYNLWDWGIQNNNTNIDINFKEGVNIFNGVWKNETLEYVQNFSIKKNPQDVIAKWFKDTLVNQDFTDSVRQFKGLPTTETCIHKMQEYEVCSICGFKHKLEDEHKK